MEHCELMHASPDPHWESEEHPATQNRSLQMYPSEQSAALLQRGLQEPFTQTSFKRQLSFEEEQVAAQVPPTHL